MATGQWIENSEDVKEYGNRFPIIYTVIVAVCVLFSLRLWYLQIMQGEEFKRFSEQNRIKEEKKLAPRGNVYDRNGELLVQNQLAFDVVITPQYIVNLENTAAEVARILGIKRDNIIDMVKKSRKQNGAFKPVKIKENIGRNEVIHIEQMGLEYPEVKVLEGIKRSYVLGENGAQLFGYTGEISKLELPVYNEKENKFVQGDIVGKAGLEKKLDSYLRGIDGARLSEVDARGREISAGSNLLLGGDPVELDYTPGKNVYLTIDKDVQQAAYEAMRSRERMGSVVVLDSKTGEVLAMVNSPSFDPNDFTAGIPPEIWSRLINDPFRPLRNKAIQDHYPPGSTFKAIVALAGLQEKVITPTSTFFCPGYLSFGRRVYHCHLPRGHGNVSVKEALERSCDVFFYKTGMALGIDRMAKYARKLGLGSRTGIGLEGEKPGLMPDSAWKEKTIGEEWQPGENLSNAIGQGFVLVTPLQLAVAYNALGTGQRVRPFAVQRVEDLEGKVLQEYKAEKPENLFTPDNTGFALDSKFLGLVQEGLEAVVNGPHGTAGSGRFRGLKMAGKTGTVQLFQIAAEKIYDKCESRPMKQRHHGWFTAFAPAEDPKIAVVVFSEHGCHGAAGAPVAHDVVLAYMKKYHPELVKDESMRVVPASGTVNPGEE